MEEHAFSVDSGNADEMRLAVSPDTATESAFKEDADAELTSAASAAPLQEVEVASPLASAWFSPRSRSDLS